MSASSGRPRALLINPWIHDFAAFDFWTRPLGLLELGGALREAGWEIFLIDCLEVNYPGRQHLHPRRRADGAGKFDQTEIRRPQPLNSIPKKYKRYGMPVPLFQHLLTDLAPPDLVLVNSVMTYWYPGVEEAVKEVRRHFPQAPVIVGGVYASLLPEHATRRTGADFVAAGDFRLSLPPILTELHLPAALPAAPVFLAWDLYPRLSSAAILTGRGCPFRCVYCAVPALHPLLVRRGPEEVVEEIKRLAQDFGVGDVAFFDDALRAGEDEHLAVILSGLIAAGSPVRLHLINGLHLRGFSRKLAELLRRARATTLRFGLETTDSLRGRALGDKADLDDLQAAVAHLRAAGYSAAEIGVYLLAGLPGQEPDEIERDIEAVLAAGARPYLSEYSPVPGSTLWPAACESSRFDLREPLFHNNTLLPCASPRLTFEVLARLKEKARRPFRPARSC